MGAMPKKMSFGMGIGFIGGILAVVAMAQTWNGTVDSIYLVGLDLLVLTAFFAVAGTFSKYSPVKGSTMALLSAVAIAVSAVALFYEALPLWMGIVLIVLGLVALLCAACPTVTGWVDANRKA